MLGIPPTSCPTSSNQPAHILLKCFFFVSLSDSIIEILFVIEGARSRSTVSTSIESGLEFWPICRCSCRSRRTIQFGNRLYWPGIRPTAHRRVCIWNVQNAQIYCRHLDRDAGSVELLSPLFFLRNVNRLWIVDLEGLISRLALT